MSPHLFMVLLCKGKEGHRRREVQYLKEKKIENKEKQNHTHVCCVYRTTVHAHSHHHHISLSQPSFHTCVKKERRIKGEKRKKRDDGRSSDQEEGEQQGTHSKENDNIYKGCKGVRCNSLFVNCMLYSSHVIYLKGEKGDSTKDILF